MFKVIVAGSRTFNDYDLLKNKLDSLFINAKDTISIVSGSAKGADLLGEVYAKERGYKLELFPADWNGLGRRAGYVRNEQMAEFSDALVAFWDGESKGTKHMIDIARRRNLDVCIVQY